MKVIGLHTWTSRHCDEATSSIADKLLARCALPDNACFRAQLYNRVKFSFCFYCSKPINCITQLVWFKTKSLRFKHHKGLKKSFYELYIWRVLVLNWYRCCSIIIFYGLAKSEYIPILFTLNRPYSSCNVFIWIPFTDLKTDWVTSPNYGVEARMVNGSKTPWLELNSSAWTHLSIRLLERPIRHFPIRTGDLMSGIRLKLGSFSELWNRMSWNRFRSNKINSVNCSFSTFSVIINENQLWSSCGRLSLKQYAGFPDTIVLYHEYFPV